MAARFKKKGELRPHFVAHWRRSRGLSQDKLAELIGTTKTTLSNIENLKTPYNQGFLESVADALNCEPADLIMRKPDAPEPAAPPTAPGDPLPIWNEIPPENREQAAEILKTFTRPRRTGR